jgi:16S rRNA (guanine1207-N2)-methyltransferase
VKLNDVKNVEIGIGDWTDNLPEGLKFDLVVSNPPTHQGREVLDKFIDGSFNVLKSDGELWVVLNRMTGVVKELEKKFRKVENVKNKKGYMVVRSLKK